MTFERAPCDNCGNLVVTTSRLCPVCGSRNPNASRNTLGVIGAVVVGGVLLIAILAGVGGSRSGAPARPAGGQPLEVVNTVAAPAETPSVAQAQPLPADVPPPPEQRPVAVEASAPDPAPAAAPPSVLASRSAAIGLALDTDRSERWRDDDGAGEVEVSDAGDKDGRPCRDYAVIENGVRSSTARVCRDADGGWRGG